jgi:methyltransferase (TIGR00027 family)
MERPVVQVTDTAAAIARFRAAEAELPAEERLFEDPFARLFCGDPAASEAADRFLSAPFFHEHVRLRTRFIDDFVRTGLADGLRQIVALGVGFDCRALRLREIEQRGATVFEVDFASQLDAKRTILAEAGVAIPGFVRFVPCDFSAPEFERRLSDDLRRAGLDPKGGTLFVCEGVFGYLGDTEGGCGLTVGLQLLDHPL